MKVLNIVLVAALAAFANAAAIAGPEAAADSAPLEKRCRASEFICCRSFGARLWVMF